MTPLTSAFQRWRAQPAWSKALLAGAFALVIWGATCGEAAEITTFTALPGENDIEVQATVLARVRIGESYYRVVLDELQRRGYPTGSPFNFRLPTLVWFLALLPSMQAGTAVMLLLGVATTALWSRSFLRQGPPRLWWLAVPLTWTMLPIWLHGGAIHLNDLWAGQLMALSLAARAAGFLPLSVASGAAAVLVRELALPYILIMGAAAVLTGRRREAWAWAGATAGVLALVAWHALYASRLAPSDALQSGWVALGGWCFALRTARMNPLLMLLPNWLHAALVSFLIAGAWMWRSASGQRVALVVTLYLAAFLAVGRPDNFYWGLLIAPILPLGALGWRRT
jgi:hypothetical protein